MATTVGPWVKLGTEYRAAMLKDRGQLGGTRDAGGTPLPKTRAFDPFLMLAIVWPSVAASVKRLAQNTRAYRGKDRAEYIRFTLGQGQIGTPNDLPVEDFLVKGRTAAGNPRQRLLPARSMLGTAAPAGTPPVLYHLPVDASAWLGEGESEAVDLLISKWDRAIGLAARAMALLAWSPELEPAATIEWWRAWDGLLIAIEVTGEVPTPDTWTMVKGGLKSSAIATGEFLQVAAQEGADLAGRAVAEVAETAGKAAGSALGGFFSQAGMTAYVVVAAALYWHFH